MSVTLPTVVVIIQLIAWPWPEPRRSRDVGAHNSADAEDPAGVPPPFADRGTIDTADQDRAEPPRHDGAVPLTGTPMRRVILGGLALIAVGVGAALAARHLRDTDVSWLFSPTLSCPITPSIPRPATSTPETCSPTWASTGDGVTVAHWFASLCAEILSRRSSTALPPRYALVGVTGHHQWVAVQTAMTALGRSG